MSSTEDRLTQLEKKYLSLLKAFDELYLDSLKQGNRIVDLEAHSVSLRGDSQRWNDVYYHVFPKRLRQDIKLHQQLHRLRSSLLPKTDKRKS